MRDFKLLEISKVFDLIPRLINIEQTTAILQLFDLGPSLGMIEQTKKKPEDHSTNQFGVVTPRAVISILLF